MTELEMEVMDHILDQMKGQVNEDVLLGLARAYHEIAEAALQRYGRKRKAVVDCSKPGTEGAKKEVM